MEAVALALLASTKERYGLELVKLSNGEIKRGGVYVLLGRMADKGFVESRVEDSTPDYIGIPRRLYKSTALGENALEVFKQIQRIRNPGLVPVLEFT